MYYNYYHNSPVKFKMTFAEINVPLIQSKKLIPLSDLSSLLYDVDLLNDCVALASIEEYHDFTFSSNFFYRNARPIKVDHKLHLDTISRNSPIIIELIVPLAAAVLGVPWLLLQAFEKIRNWRLNREKLELEVQKLKLDTQLLNIENLERILNLNDRLNQRNANNVFEGLNKRFDKGNLIATDLEIDFLIDENSKNDDNPK